MRGATIIGITITTGNGMNIVISRRPLVSTGVWMLMFADLPGINHKRILMTWVTRVIFFAAFLFADVLNLPIVKPVEEFTDFFSWNEKFLFCGEDGVYEKFPGEVVFDLFHNIEVDEVLSV